MKLSVIIPIYNVEGTLRRCVESVRRQAVEGMEIILVDDGSPDGSGAIADSLARDDSRIRVLHKANGGLSSARNCGMDHATGQYIAFVDSDDALADGTLEAAAATLDAHPQCGIAEFAVLQNPGRNDQTLFAPTETAPIGARQWLERRGLAHCWAWNKMYRRSMAGDLRFPEGRTYEDVWFTALWVERGLRVATVAKGMYLYYDNPRGITACERSKGMASLLEAQMGVVGKLRIDTADKRWGKLYIDMFTIQLHAFRATGRAALPSRKVAPDLRRGLGWNIKALMASWLGVERSCRLFAFFKKKKD